MNAAHEAPNPEEAERRAAILAAENICQRCGTTAWSYSLEAAMRLVPKRRDSRQKEIVCESCAEKAKKPKGERRRAA